jgi:prepilin-type processing-associated H-X9-DG protein
VATIAILIAILLPALSRAKDQGKRTACLSNLHQFGVAIFTYAHDYEQKIPFGPKAPPFVTAADFYPATGTPTNLLSLLDGAPAAAGLLIKDYLSKTPKVLFCPGSDQASDADVQLANFGIRQAQGSYFYRHGSIAASGDAPIVMERWNRNLKISDLGLNRNNEPVRALAIDANYPVGSGLAAFGIVTRTHHQLKTANILFSDGHASVSQNLNKRYTLDLNNAAVILSAFNEILKILERADQEHQ